MSAQPVFNQYPHKPSSFELYFSPNGRVQRQVYWMNYMLLFFFLSILASLLDTVAGTSLDPELGIGLFSTILSVLTFWPSLVIAIKRCHDFDTTGWFLLLLLIPVVNLWVIIKLWFYSGTYGTNRYGIDPIINS